MVIEVVSKLFSLDNTLLPAAIGWPSSRWGGSCSSSAWTAHVRTASWWRRCVELCPVGRPSSVAQAWLPSWRRGGKTRGWSTWRSLWAWTAPCTSCTLSECLRRTGWEGAEVRSRPGWIWQARLSPVVWCGRICHPLWTPASSSVKGGQW